MYKLMISLKNVSTNVNLGFQTGLKEYLLPNEVEVCKVITKLSHLEPIITLCSVTVLSAAEVLKDFEPKEV